jgi:hypothetical protein
MALSAGTLVIALVRGPRYPKEAIENLGSTLLLPYILIQPLCYFEVLGLGLGGDMIRSGYYGTLSLTAIILIPVTFFGLLFASRRARGAE